MGHEAVRAGSGFRVCRNCQGLCCRSFELRFEQHALVFGTSFPFWGAGAAGMAGRLGWHGGWWGGSCN